MFPDWMQEFIDDQERKTEEAEARFDALCDVKLKPGETVTLVIQRG